MKQTSRMLPQHKMIIGLLSVFLTLAVFVTTAAAQERLCITANIANMRSGPGTKFDYIWQAEKYYPVIVIEKKGKWYKVKDFENDVAWVHQSLLGKFRCVMTKKNKCNVRAEPSTKKGEVVFTVERGVPFKVLKEKENWLKVEHKDGDVGWIHKSLVW